MLATGPMSTVSYWFNNFDIVAVEAFTAALEALAHLLAGQH